MVMAAGMGTRMRPLTVHRPKPLIQIGPETLLDHVLGHLRRAGIGKIIVNVHYLADQIEAHLAQYARDFDVSISDERGQLLETGGGLMQAKPLFSSDPLFCVNTDNVWIDTQENSLAKMTAHWDDAKIDVLMLLVPTAHAQHHAGSGDFFIENDGQLRRRGTADTAPFVWTGIQILSQRLLVNPPSAKFSTNILWDRAMAQGRMFAVEHAGAWIDVGTPDAVAPAAAALAQSEGILQAGAAPKATDAQ
jgi:MurNAc alpha-1-phosphate uridylyltransferase